jgi:chemotaxis protein methyltransferase CheR
VLADSEINIVLQDLKDLYRYDFMSYSRESFKRRINRLYVLEQYQSFDEFRTKLKADEAYIEHLIDRITVKVTEMFRDLSLFRELRTEVLSELADRPLIRVWHAGCSTGEEVYSMAILLHEAGLLEKSHIVATDINPYVLAKAREGIFSETLLRAYEENYYLAGGERDFRSYFTATAKGDKISEQISSPIVFNFHSLASDGYLNRFDLVFCRNVLIYFDQTLRERALDLLDISTGPGSFLVLGERETLKFSSIEPGFGQYGKETIWRKL